MGITVLSLFDGISCGQIALERDGVETDYFRYIDVDSTFMQLAIGDNMFRYDAASGVNSLEVSIFYSKEFLGV